MNNINIEHLILSGGAYLGYYHIGALQFLEKHNFIKRENLKSIYGTSIGSLVSVLLCLKLDWDIIDDYIIKRPWEKIFELDLDKLMDIFKIKGLFNKSLFNKVFDPLFLSCNLKKDITLKELYEYSNIELHIFAVDIISLKLKNFSYKTNPNMSVIDAVYMSCSLPFIFEPYEIYDTINDGKERNNIKSVCIDGCIFNSYPTDICIKEQIDNDSDKLNTLFGITFDRINNITNKNIEHKYDTKVNNIFEFGNFLFRQMSSKIYELEERNKVLENDNIHKNVDNNINKNKNINIKYELRIPCKSIHLEEGINIFLNENTRKKYIEDGEKYAYVFFNSVISSHL